jgi:uncharacterized protein
VQNVLGHIDFASLKLSFIAFMRFLMNDTVESPCIAVCQLDDEEQFCIGCYRTPLEIEQWTNLSEQEKARLLKQLEQRRKDSVY